jgi:hypothetical protein
VAPGVRRPYSRGVGPRRTLSVLAALAAGCHGNRAERARHTHELTACVEALARAPRLDPGPRLLALARGCAPACPGLTGWADATDGTGTQAQARLWRRDWTADGGAPGPRADTAARTLIAACGLPCAADAPAGPPGRLDRLWPAVEARCGASLDLGAGRAALASTEWWVLSRVAGWLDGVRKGPLDDDQLPAQLERAVRGARFALPLPGHDDAAGYVLPASRHGQPTDAALYVVVGRTAVRAGAVPVARLRGPDLDVQLGPGADFPGARLDDDQIGQAFAEDVAALETERPGEPGRPPLLLIDRATPIARIETVFAQLGVAQAEVGVAATSARAHEVRIERPSLETEAAPELVVTADGHLRIAGFGDDRITTWDGIDDELDNFAAVNAPVRKLALVLEVPIDATRLVRLLDACAIAHVAALVVPAPAPG